MLANDVGKFGEIPLKQYKKPTSLGLKQVFVGPLLPPNPDPSGLKSYVRIDDMWLASFFVTEIGSCPSWSDFNQTICQGKFETSKIDILPFVNYDPTQPDTLYSALSFVQDCTRKYKLGAVPVTFDQPLYIKAAEIVASFPDLTGVCCQARRLSLYYVLFGLLGIYHE